MAVEFYDWVFLLGWLTSTLITGFSMWSLAFLGTDSYPNKILRAIFLNAGNGIGMVLAMAGYFTSTLTGPSMFLLNMYMAYIPLNLLYLIACIGWTAKEKASKRYTESYYALGKKAF